MVAWRAMTCGPALPTDPSALSALSALSDAAQVGLWLCVLAGGLAFCVGLRRAGLATTYVRDLLHIGAGVWAFGLRLWHGARAPIAITLAAVLALALVPRVAPRLRALARCVKPLARQLRKGRAGGIGDAAATDASIAFGEGPGAESPAPRGMKKRKKTK